MWSKTSTHPRISAVFGVNVKLTLAFRRSGAFGRKKRRKRRVNAENHEFLDFRLLLFACVFHTFEISVLACTAPTSKINETHNVNATI